MELIFCLIQLLQNWLLDKKNRDTVHLNSSHWLQLDHQIPLASELAFEQSVHFSVYSSLAVHCVQLMLICTLCVYPVSEKM